MKNSQLSKLKTYMMLLAAVGVMYSCSKESISDDLSDTNLQFTKMQEVTAESCENDCIEPGSEIFYPVSGEAALSVGINTKSVSYTAYNTETDFVVEVTYTITAGPANAKATITIDIDGDAVEYTEVSSGSTVSHTVPLADEWAGCDPVAFSVVQEALGTPITFSESYALIPVCPELVLEIGMEYQGGIIAYILQPGDTGYDANETRGIIAAPEDQSEGIQWYNGILTITGVTDRTIGAGQANTTAIVTNQGTGSYAAQLCNDLVLNGFSDWYLPSRDELDKLYESKDVIGGFASKFYWSSTERNQFGAWGQGFSDVYYQGSDRKDFVFYVRAVRSF